MTISRSVFLRMSNVSDKRCRENQNTLSIFNNFFPKIVPHVRYYRKIWQSQTGHRRQYDMNIICWIPKTTDTHSEYVKLIAFPLQQWLAILPECYVYNAFLLLLYVVRHVPALTKSHFQAL